MTKVTVIRHPKEKSRKCSLRFLEGHADFTFLRAHEDLIFDASGFMLLEMGAPSVSEADANLPILLLDSTWRLLPNLRAKVRGDYVARSIPPSIKTAYPRTSKMFADPEGLATLEALYAALKLTGKPNVQILKHYPFARKFLEINDWLDDLPRVDFFDASESVFCESDSF